MKRSERLQQQREAGRMARHPMNMIAKGIMVKDFSLVTDEGEKVIVFKMPDNLAPNDDAWWLGILRDLDLYYLEAFDPQIFDDFTSSRINKIASPALMLLGDIDNDWDMWYVRYNRGSGKLSLASWLTSNDEPDAYECMQMYKNLEGSLVGA
jgi:hypothetical protein